MLISCDVDGVIADLHPEWLRRYNRDYTDTMVPADIHAWEMHRFVKPECGKKIYDYLHDPDLYAHVAPMAGAQLHVRNLRDRGHRLVFVTSNVKGMLDQKWTWLETWGFLTPGATTPDLVSATDKSFFACDVAIDDYHENLRTSKAMHRLLYQQPWNRNVYGPWQFVKTWSETVAMIDTIEFASERFSA